MEDRGLAASQVCFQIQIGVESSLAVITLLLEMAICVRVVVPFLPLSPVMTSAFGPV